MIYKKILTVLECDAGEALNDALQFKYVLELFDTNLYLTNKKLIDGAVAFTNENS